MQQPNSKIKAPFLTSKPHFPFLGFDSDKSKKPLWRGQSSRIPRYLELKTQSNQDIRELRISPPSPSPSSTSRVRTTPKINSEEITDQENHPPSQTSNAFQSRIEDIRFQPARESSTTTSIPSHQSNSIKPKFTNESTRPAFYNRGQPRTYLSDRHVRNIDVREFSSRVSHGYQYPSPSAQSSGPMKKVPEGFTRPKASPKTFTTSKLKIIFIRKFFTEKYS